MEDSDHDLMKAIGTGDHLAFEVLVGRYQCSLLNFIYRQVGDRHTAEDLTQEVFLRVYRASPEFEARGKVSTWIFQIAYNLCLNEMKRLRRCKRLFENLNDEEMESLKCAASDAIGLYEQQTVMLNAFAGLPENQRAALFLRVNEGLSYFEISKVLSTSIPSVESLIYRARLRLGELLGRE